MLVIVILILVIVFLCVAISAMSSSSKSNKLAQKKILDEQREKERKEKASEEQKDSGFEEEWDLMTRYDSSTRANIERLEKYGEAAVEELKRVYKVMRDKERLSDVTDQIIADIESGKLQIGTQVDSASGSSEMFTERDLDSKGLTADGNCQVFKAYQVRHRDDGNWWVETRDGELHPSFKSGFVSLGKAKRAAASKLGQERLNLSGSGNDLQT